ncbi:MAG: acetyl/propionyl-CoA carboxylase subuit alpha [marine bacterium B5-7]|nr:MAG: acetyl/propionyl-CoA carboxylase subuit alpha [marine bacterium B5-7]
MPKKILIANRGEIACRAIKTARRMGISTVAIFSEADRDAVHVSMADEAHLLGESSPASSYLNIDRIIEICTESGADAVYPGYGFLSENGTFVKALDARGIAFIGPSAHAIAAMGDKIESKILAEKAGVNTIPGSNLALRDGDHAVELAAEIGYPVMLKASKGGGGKGMRIAFDDAGCRDGFDRARSEAIASFGDDTIFIEKFITEPRHIEIQLLADREGNCVYLNERECSIQRRHQKVIEEAPSAFIDENTRQKMGRQAVALAQAVGYYSAGTVEFIVDADRNFYFLEMNTRLQVEHPVTEFITGLDLIELMIRVADGEPLPLTQDDVRRDGWAIEARVYAEDPYRGFLPSIGRLSLYKPPCENAHVRVDSGVEEGSDITMYYDPMIAKLITYDVDRDSAIKRMGDALDAFYVRGVSTNVPFLATLVKHERFLSAQLTTAFLDDTYPDGFSKQIPVGDDLLQFVIVAAYMHNAYCRRAASTDGVMSGYENNVSSNWVVLFGQDEYTVTLCDKQPVMMEIADRQFEVDTDWKFGQPLMHVSIDALSATFQVSRSANDYTIIHGGFEITLSVYTPKGATYRRLMLDKPEIDLSRYLMSPMPGLLVSLLVSEGQAVKAGEQVAVIEAMKMENTLRAIRDGVVSVVHVNEGSTVELDQAIIEFES